MEGIIMNKPVDVVEDWNVISISLKDSELEIVTRISRAYQISISDAIRALLADAEYISFRTIERALTKLNISSAVVDADQF
jgi:hypothetical protein